VSTTTTSPGLHCEVEPDRDRVVVRPIGEIDLASIAVVDAPLQELRASGFETLVLDLRHVTFIDSTGLHLLLRWARRAEDDGFRLSIELAADGPVARILQLTGLVDVLPVTGG
jgi:anti-anti-sigma factor